MAKKLSEQQIAAITILSQPKRAGLTYKQVAEKVGVSEQSIHNWRKLDVFNDELKREIVRNTLDRLPDIMQSIPDHIINDGNAALFRTLLQAHGLLTDRVEVTAKDGQTDVDSIKAEIERLKHRK
jgi:uncharacterized protein YjcR